MYIHNTGFRLKGLSHRFRMASPRPSDLWAGWLGPGRYAQPTRWMMFSLPSLLVEQGLEAPPQRRVEGDALADLDPLELQSVPTIHAPTKLFSFVHFLNLLWQPLIRYINSTAEGREPAWSETLSKHQQSLIAEMDGDRAIRKRDPRLRRVD